MSKKSAEGAELAKTLIRSVVRAFYDIREIIVVECLAIHTALRDDDLQALTTFTIKDLHKLCAKLTDDRLIATHHRNEIREGQQRAQSRTYYYIDYRQAIDAIKWRAYCVSKDVQGTTVVQSEKKEYFCPRCKSAWGQLEIVDNFGPMGAECHTCGALLVHDPSRTEVGHEESTRLNTQFQFITDKLREIDEVRIPDNTFDVAYGNRREVVRDATNPVLASVAVEPGTKRPSAVLGLQNTGPKSIAVSISTGDGPNEADVAAERARKEKIAKQNEMPEWMKASTVTGESFRGAAATDTLVKHETAETKDHANVQEHHAEVDDLFARLRAQQAAEQAAGKGVGDESGSDDEDDDEGDFEDVVATNGAGADADASGASQAIDSASQPAPPAAPAAAPAEKAASGASSPSKRSFDNGAGAGAPVEDERLVKKVKVEEPVIKVEAAEDSEDEELEFEDV